MRALSLIRPGLYCGAMLLLPCIVVPLLPHGGQAAPSRKPLRSARRLFWSPASRMEQEFVANLPHAGEMLVPVRTVDDPEAVAARVTETPTLIATDASGREVARAVGADQVNAVLKAHAAPATCAVSHGPRLKWIEETDPRAAQVYRRFSRQDVPEIFKAMSLRPELMEKVLDLSERGHFSDGYLDTRTKERIATLVSSLNHSRYCLGSHAGGLQQLGSSTQEIWSLSHGDAAVPALTAKDRALLQFARELTLHPGDVSDTDIHRLKAAGWRDEQVFEAAFDTALFAFFNRIANTYGLEYPSDGWKPAIKVAGARTARAR